MRKLGIVLGILFLLIVIAGIVFYATFDINDYRGRIQSELQQRLGRDISLGDMHLKIFPPSFEVQNVSIADDPCVRQPGAIRAGSGTGRLRPTCSAVPQAG